MIRKWVGWLVFALVAAGVVVGVMKYRKAHAPPPIEFKTAKIAKQRIVGKITATGTLSATITVQVGAQVSGRISKLGADWNSQVKKGQLIAKIDPLLFDAAVEQANANYVSAKASVEKAVATAAQADRVYQRELALLKESLAAQQDVDTAETAATTAKADIEVQKASLQQAKAQLDQAKVNLSYTSIFSPIDGTVISRSVDVGQTVASSFTAPVLFTIAEDLRKMQVNTNIAEGDVGRLQQGQTTTFTVDAFPGEKFRGRISQIRNAATTVSNVVTYDAVIDVDNTDLRLRPGMTANTTVIYEEKRDAIAAPNTALRFKPPPELTALLPASASSNAPPSASAFVPDPPPASASASPSASASASAAPSSSAGAPAPDAPAGTRGSHGNRRNKGEPSDSRTIWVLHDGKPEPRSVKIGLSDGTVTEIVSGDLNEGDDVIIDATVNGDSVAPAASSAKRGGGAPRMF